MLRITPKILIALALFSGVTIASETVKEVDAQQAASLQQIGDVSVSGVRGSPDDALRALGYKVEAIGGHYYKVIALGTAGDSSLWRGAAIVYK